MILEPDEALDVIAKARRARGIRNLPAFVIQRWRAARARGIRRHPPPAAALVSGVDLAALEYVWSRPETMVTAAVLKAMGAAIDRQGGCSTLHDGSFERPGVLVQLFR